MPQYDLEHIPTISKENIRNCLEVLNLIDGEPEELWDDLKEIVKDECEKSLLKMKKEKKANWMSEHIMEICKKRSEAKAKQDKNLRKEFNKVSENC